MMEQHRFFLNILALKDSTLPFRLLTSFSCQHKLSGGVERFHDLHSSHSIMHEPSSFKLQRTFSYHDDQLSDTVTYVRPSECHRLY